MASVIEQHKLVFVKNSINSNKVWIVKLYDNDDVEVEFGRIANKLKLQSKMFKGVGRSYMEQKIREKKRPSSHYDGGAYVELDTVDSPSISVSPTTKHGNTELKKLATKQIATCPVTEKLVAFFTDINAHDIFNATGGRIKYNADKGLFQTPLGIVTKDAVTAARAKLDLIGGYVSKNKLGDSRFIKTLEEYLMLIPQDTSRKFDPASFIGSQTKVQAQNALLDGLEASYSAVIASASTDDGKKDTAEPIIFNVKMSVLTDKTEFDRIEKKYKSTNKDMHVSSRLKLQRVYSIEISSNKKDYNDCKIDNINEFFHGSRASNCLSILKKGLVIPPSTASYVCGRAYGDGIYSSPISSKALNYSTGYWSGRDEGKYYMFLVDFKMGKTFIPKDYHGKYPATGYDSTWAKSNVSGVLNDECIVYKTNQVLLKYLMEFSN